MSNASILDRLDSELVAYEKGERNSAEFCSTLESCIQAMDGVSYAKIREMRHFSYELEVEGYHSDDGRFADRCSIIRRLRDWLREFRKDSDQVIDK